jgi:capsular exopolysaccharide synthesis family protein
MLRTNLFYALEDAHPQVIVLTSAGPGEGKSTITANLGVTLAQAGKDTLLVDGDLRKPRLYTYFGMRNLEGLVDVLIGETALQEIYREVMPGLKLVTPGLLPPNPAELLSSRSLAEFFGQVRPHFAYILVDTPPIGQVADSAILAANADGALLVLDSQRTSKRSIRQALHTLEGVRAHMLGVVMNNYSPPGDGYSYPDGFPSGYSQYGAK